MIIRKDMFKKTLWKNGLGQTDEIAIHPGDSTLERGDFLWRISSARVDHDSAFSIFPDHDRVLLVLEGNGIELDQDQNTHEISPLEPFEFGGEIETRGHLKNGPIRDLNVFTRKGKVKSVVEVRRFRLNEFHDWSANSDWNYAFAVTGKFETSEGTFDAGDACSSDQSTRLKSLSDNGIIVLISLDKIGK